MKVFYTMVPLTYTTAPPTTPGWYWMRLPGGEPQHAEVFYDRNGELRVHYGNSPVNPRRTAFPNSTRWAGPIPRPVEA